MYYGCSWFTMKIGFIGFGEVSYRLSKIFFENGFDVLTSVEGRSIKTRGFVNSIDYIELLSTFEEVAKESDILISANSPHSALGIALRYGSLTNGVYLDFNNISPDTSKQIANFLGDDHFVDSVIMGKVKSKELNIYLSGKLANKVESFIMDNLDSGVDSKINTVVISENIGDVSALKILRSSYTKGVSALLIETFESAKKLGLEDELWNILDLTENKPFRESATSRINNSYKSSKRKYEELEEVLEFLDSFSDKKEKLMSIATRDKFKYLKNRDFDN